MRLDYPCDLCGKNPRSGRAALAAFRGHARPSPPPVSGPLAGAVSVLWAHGPCRNPSYAHHRRVAHHRRT